MALKMSMESHKLLLDLVLKIQERHRQNHEFRDKMSAIDTEYATQVYTNNESDTDCTESIEGIKVPLVGSEIDSITANLASIFVSRSPIFPVLATKDNWDEALALQAIIDRDARMQSWGRQILLFLNRAVRYNVSALAGEQTIVRSPIISEDQKPSSSDLMVTYEEHLFTTLKSIDMYNCLYDPRVPPAEIMQRGEYAGYNEIVSRSELKTLGSNLAKKELAYNLDKAYRSTMQDVQNSYFSPPDVSDYISTKHADTQTDWLDWLGILNTYDKRALLDDDSYFKTVLYVRIIPQEFKIGKSKTPEIWKLTVVNNEWIISLQQIITPFNNLPIMFSDIREDGLGWQTKSPGENIIPYEDVATELLNTRLNGSRRALADRAIFDPNYIDSNQVNSKVPAAKIPLKQDLRNLGDGISKPMNQIYYPIPFEGQGVVNSLTDLNTVMEIKDQVNGQNFTSRGARQKGNRTAAEFNSIEATTEGKTLPYAIRLEQQIFTPLKLLIKTYILLSQSVAGKEEVVVDPYTEQDRTINIASMRSKMIDFRITDGLFDKQNFENPEVLITAIQTISTSEQFMQEYDVGKVLADFLHIFNVDVNKYRRTPPNAAQPPAPVLPGPGTTGPAQPPGGQGQAPGPNSAQPPQPGGDGQPGQEPVS